MMMYNMGVDGRILDIPQKTSKWTHIKHSNFMHFLDTMMDHWFQNNNEHFWLIDLNAGAGIYPSGLKTMSLRFIEKYLDSGLDPQLLTGILCEADKKSRHLFADVLIEHDVRENFKILSDNTTIPCVSVNNSKGLILYDPNDPGDFNLVQPILQMYPNMDIFMHLQPGFAPRRFWYDDYVPMFESIRNIQRPKILVSDVYNKYIDCVAVNSMSTKLKVSTEFTVPNSQKGYRIFRKIYYRWKGPGRLLTSERFIKRSIRVHGDTYSYKKVKYHNAHSPVTVTCSIHGDFNISPHNHLIGSGCPRCGWLNGWLNRSSGLKKVTLEDFIRRSTEIHNSFYQYDKVEEFQNTSQKVTITCPIHGDFEQFIWSHLNGRGCLQCAHDKRAQKMCLTTDIFVSRAKEKFGDKLLYHKTEYINAKTKVTVTCPIHGDFKQLPGHHLKGTGCPLCTNYAKALTQEDFITRAKTVHGDKYTYEKSVFSRVADPITITCPIHGDFTVLANNFLRGHGCMKCSRGSITIEEFILEAKKVHGDKYSYDKTRYTKANDKVVITCPVHGDFEQIASNHLRGMGCRKCSMSKLGAKRQITQSQFIEKAKAIHGDKYDYSLAVYTGVRNKVEIICPIHGSFHQVAGSHIIKGYGCKKCGQAARKKRKQDNPEN